MRTTLPTGTPVEVAQPEGAPARGGVVIPDIRGLRPLFDDMCANLARDHRWRVAAIEPFPGREELPVEERLEHGVAELEDDRLLEDVRCAADQLGTERTAVLGFCMGGMFSLKAAGINRFDRAVSFYGMISVPRQFRGPGQREPLEYLGREGACPVLAILGGHDQWTPPDDIDALRQIDHA